MKKLVLFGAGVYARKYQAILEFLNIDFDFFTDNDKTLHRSYVLGKKVIAPEQLIDLDCHIIISCTHTEAIKKQLKNMNILDKVIDITYFYKMFEQKSLMCDRTTYTNTIQKEPSILIDMYEGVGWGGTEIWAAKVAKGINTNGKKVYILGADTQVYLEEIYEQHVKRFSESNIIESLVKVIEDNLPCTIINNFVGSVLLAAIYVKMRYPEQVRIISVIHNDSKSLYDEHIAFNQYVDAFMCVSNKIRETVIENYNIDERKVYFKEQPIEFEESILRKYSKSNEPLRVGYGGRIIKQQKRADLFPRLIKFLEDKVKNYRLEIAGEGSCLEEIDYYISQNGLKEKVRLLGRIDKYKMPEFWKRQDVFINFSEYEGTSLAMLEAMSYGCIPVVTDVSGASEFITNGQNGYICNIGNIEGLVERLTHLEQNRELLAQYGKICREIIKERCKEEDYIKYIEQVIEDCW